MRNARLEPREPTATELASAYKDATARDIITRARQARAVQDSSLRSYDATVTQRISAGLNIKAIGADRLLFRSELAARVRWMTPDRVVVDMLGARTASPVAFPGTRVLTGFAEMVPIPWFTGAEGLMWWFNMDGGEDPGDEDDNPFRYLHPLADGAEVAYTYEAGEAATIRLPSGRTLALHEVIVRPREAQQEYIAGSLWFEAGAGQLVRAVFRPAAPFDMKQMLEREGDLEDIPAPIRSTLMTPFDFDVESFTVDYGLHEEKWWLPRVQSARGLLRTGFVRSTATIDQRFRYASVDGLDSLPAIPRGRDRFSRDVGDDVGFMVSGLVDAAVPGRVGRPREEVGMRCAKGDTTQHRQRRGDLRILVRTPCDTAALAHSDLLPPSIFEPGEEAFGIAETRALAKELKVDELLATRGGAAPPSSSPWTLTWGLQRGMLRYNRVEGLSAGVLAERPVGRGITMATTVRLGSADLEPNAEVRFIRDRLGRSLTLGAYRRLDVVDDWGDPFGIGGSLSALLFGRDEGHYARGTGIDLVGLHARGAVTWRLFAERQDGAVVETDLSLPHLTREARFRPNVRAAEADEGGGQLRIRLERGLDPQGWRVASEARLEAAAGSYDYTRAAGSASLSRGLFNMAAVSVSGSAGTSGGQLTPQRAWRLGGTHTVRGHRPAVQSGNAFWLARAEVGRSGAGMRPVAFYDMGWAGDRTAWNVGEKVRGAGVGLSILDGLMRVDLARGVRPTTAWRAHLYVEARF
ncbi:MAG: hypothetical protein JNL26_11630 [Gemmatimonadetes bacterium]|nr:hypothetical protein [Gemmatimonadota bacterium]